MLTMRSRFATVLVWFRPVVPRHSPHAVFLMNHDESEWIGMAVISRFTPNAHKWPRLHLPHLKYEPGAATVELRFRPSPQSTTIQPECFNRFKTALACRGGSRITRILLELLKYYYDSHRCLHVAATNHTDASRFDKLGLILAIEGPKSLLCDWGLKKRKLYVRQMLVAQKSMNNVELYLLCVLNLYI